MPACFPKWHEKPGFLLILFCCLYAIGNTQPIGLQAEMELNYGLRHNSVRTIVQDSSGRTYLGTESGLVILNSNDAHLDTIVRRTGKMAIVSINLFGDYLFLGTVANGLKIHDLKRRKTVWSPFMDSIRYVRHIRKIDDELYIAANSSSWHVFKKDDILHFEKIHRPERYGFFTDFHPYKGKVFGFDLQKMPFSSRFYEIKGKSALPCPFPPGYPENPIYTYLTAISKESRVATAGDGFYHVIQPGKTPVFKHLQDSITKLNYPVWDMTFAKDRLFLALGQQFQLTMGMTYQVGVNSLTDVRKDFFGQSLYYNPKHDALWIGTYNRGLFVWPKVTLSQRLPVNIPGLSRIVAGGKGQYFVYSESDVYRFDKEAGELSPVDVRQKEAVADEILQMDYLRDTLAVLRNNSLAFYNAKGEKIKEYSFSNYRYSYHIRSGDSIFYFTMHNSGIHAQHKKDPDATIIPGISIGAIAKAYGKGFIFFSDEKGFYYHDSVNHTLQSEITKLEEFEIVGNRIWILNAGRVESMEIDIEQSKLVPLGDVVISELIKGFVPNWIRSHDGRIFIGNNKGLMELDSLKGLPLWYSHLGNYQSNRNPILDGDTLVMLQNEYLEKQPLRQPYALEDIQKFGMQLDREEGLYARFPLTILVNHPDYFLQRYALKKLEMTDGSGALHVLYSLDGKFDFPSGLTRGQYKVKLFVNNVMVREMSFRISIPILQNPIFYTLLASLVILVFYQFFRYRAKQQELERNMLENRLQLLKKNLDPHFIFNSLNLTYMLLLQENNKEAIDSITRFSDLHRYFLEMINKREISLAEELRFICNYLELEHKRVHLDAPFEYTISPYDENAVTINIPPMILHPLVENAVKYCGFDPTQTDHSSIRIDILLNGHLATIGIENSLGMDENRSSIGFRRGVEIVRETIAIYNKMGHNQINFHPNRPPTYFQPGFRCELVIDMEQ
ncbi:MAG: hypothetical protein RLY85_2132 [Bacteroidota bacterium]